MCIAGNPSTHVNLVKLDHNKIASIYLFYYSLLCQHTRDGNITSTEDESTVVPTKLSSSTSNLRFFGDTDQESNADSIRGLKPSKKRPGLRTQSTRDLHNISEERKSSNMGRNSDIHHKSLTNISELERERYFTSHFI